MWTSTSGCTRNCARERNGEPGGVQRSSNTPDVDNRRLPRWAPTQRITPTSRELSAVRVGITLSSVYLGYPVRAVPV